MTYYPDLGPCDYFATDWTFCLRAVGWLEPGHDYKRGTPSAAFVEKLTELLKSPWQPVWFPGIYCCGFCEPEIKATMPPEAVFNATPRGGNNLFVPESTSVYVAPDLVQHYIEAHGYCPPEEFRAAVMRCPEMCSLEYFDAVKATKLFKGLERYLVEEKGQSWEEHVREQREIRDPQPPQWLVKLREKYARAYEPWTQEEENALVKEFEAESSIDEIAESLQRQFFEVRAKLEKLDLFPH